MMRKLLKITGIALAVIVIVPTVFIATFDANRYKDEITEAVEKATGRKLQINGQVNLKLFNFPTMFIEQVNLSNADWASTQQMASMELLELDLALKPLLKGMIQVNKLTLVKPIISLETNPQGEGNWVFAGAEPTDEDTKSSESQSFGLILDNIMIEDAEFHYIDGVNQQTHSVHLDSLSLHKQNPTALALELKARYQDAPVKLTAMTAPVQSWLNNETVPIDLELLANDSARLNLKGQLIEPVSQQNLQATLKASIDALADLSTLAGKELPALEPISVVADIHRNQDDYAANNLSIKLGESDLGGQVNVNMATAIPTVRAELTSSLVDLSPILAVAQNPAEPVQAEQANNLNDNDNDASEPDPTGLPIAALKAVNAAVKLSLAELKTPTINLSQIQLNVDLKEGELKINPIQLSVAGGELKGNLHIDGRQPTAQIKSNVAIGHITLSQLPELSNYLSDSQTDLSLNLSATGETVEQLLASLQGQLSFNTDKLSIKAAQWAGKPDFLGLDKLALDVAFEQAGKKINLNKLHLLNPVLNAEVNDKGIGNWVMADSSESTQTATAENEQGSKDQTFDIELDDIKVVNADIQYIDGISRQNYRLLVDELKLDEKNADLLNINTRAHYQDTAIQLTGSTGKLMSLLKDNRFPVTLTTQLGNQAKLDIQGYIDAPLSQQTLQLKINSQINRLASLSKLAGTELPDLKPLTLSSNFSRQGDKVSIQDLIFTHGRSDLSGTMVVDLAAKQPVITADLKSKLLDLTEMPKSEQTEDAPKQAENNDKVFPSDPLPIELLNKLVGEITVRANKIKTDLMEIDQTRLTAKAGNGKLTITPLKATMAGGQLNGYVQVAALKNTAAINTDINITALQLAQIKSLNEQVTEGGATDVLIRLTGKGNSVSAIMAEANGVLTIQTQAARLNADGGLLTSDLITGLFPTGESDNKLQLECAVVNYKINEGIAIADKGIAIVTDKINIIGSSEINLKTEALDIDLKPHVREGLGVSVAELADLISIGGTLAKPSMGADALSTLTTGLGTQTAIATGGLSILAKGLFDKITADSDPCGTALGVSSSSADEALDDSQSNSQPEN